MIPFGRRVVVLLCLSAGCWTALSVEPTVFYQRINGRNVGDRDYVLLRGELTPAVLVRAKLKDVTIFNGGKWQAQTVALATRDGIKTLTGDDPFMAAWRNSRPIRTGATISCFTSTFTATTAPDWAPATRPVGQAWWPG